MNTLPVNTVANALISSNHTPVFYDASGKYLPLPTKWDISQHGMVTGHTENDVLVRARYGIPPADSPLLARTGGVANYYLGADAEGYLRFESAVNRANTSGPGLKAIIGLDIPMGLLDDESVTDLAVALMPAEVDTVTNWWLNLSKNAEFNSNPLPPNRLIPVPGVPQSLLERYYTQGAWSLAQGVDLEMITGSESDALKLLSTVLLDAHRRMTHPGGIDFSVVRPIGAGSTDIPSVNIPLKWALKVFSLPGSAMNGDDKASLIPVPDSPSEPAAVAKDSASKGLTIEQIDQLQTLLRQLSTLAGTPSKS